MKKLVIILLVMPLTFISCLKDESKQPTNKAVVVDVYQSFNNFYANFEARPSFDSLYSVCISNLHEGMSENEFFYQLGQFIGGLKDPHISLYSKDKEFHSEALIHPPVNIDKQRIVQYYINSNFNTNDVCTYGLINNIGYLYLPHFMNDTTYDELPAEVFNAMQFLMNTDGLIIDLRENYGGQGYYVKELLGYFATEKKYWFSSQNRKKDGFDESYEWYIEPDESYHYSKGVVVLTSRYTVSAAERFLFGAKVLPQMTVVGTRSAGTQGGVMGRETLNGWEYTLTFERVYGPDGVNYDYVGIPPDIEILDSVQVFPPNEDPLLEQALTILQ